MCIFWNKKASEHLCRVQQNTVGHRFQLKISNNYLDFARKTSYLHLKNTIFWDRPRSSAYSVQLSPSWKNSAQLSSGFHWDPSLGWPALLSYYLPKKKEKIYKKDGKDIPGEPISLCIQDGSQWHWHLNPSENQNWAGQSFSKLVWVGLSTLTISACPRKWHFSDANLRSSVQNLSDYYLFSVVISVPLCSAALYRGVQNKVYKFLISENTHYSTVYCSPHLSSSNPICTHQNSSTFSATCYFYIYKKATIIIKSIMLS